jgi:4-hydroxybenzoate polyprenyltransferase
MRSLKKIRLLNFGVASRDAQRILILMLFGMALGIAGFNVLTLLLFTFSLCSLLSTDIFANIVNDIYDIEVDAETKPFRPLPSGEVKIEEGIKGSIIFAFVAVVSAIVTYVLSVNLLLLAILLFALLLSYVYSTPPIRLKSRSWFGPITLSAAYYTSAVSGFLIGGAEMSRISILCIIFLTVFLSSSVKDFED